MKKFITEYFLILCVSYLFIVKNVTYSSCVTDQFLKMSFLCVSSWILESMLSGLLVNLEQKKSEWLMEFPIKERLTKNYFK